MVVLPLCVAASGATSWTSVHSNNFLLIGDAAEIDIRLVSARLEQLHAAFKQHFPTLKLDNGARTTVVVFRDTQSFMPFKPRRGDGSVDDAVSGFFVPGEGVNYIALPFANARSDPFGTVSHEYVHFVLSATFGRDVVPPWLNEGLAEFFQTVRFDDGAAAYIGGTRPEHLNLLRKSTPIPLRTLIETDAEALKAGSDQQRRIFYAEAWAAVHFLMQGTAGPAERLAKFVPLLNGKGDREEIFRSAFGMDYQSAEIALRAYIEKPSPPPVPVSLAAGPDPELSVSSLSESDVNAYLGDLLFRIGDAAGAESLLRRSVATDARSVLANTSLGVFLARRNRFGEAKKYLEAAASSGQADHLAFFNYALTLSQLESDERGMIVRFSPENEKLMRAALLRAIEMKPDYAESYRLLAFVDLVNGGDLEEASRLLRTGLTIRPEDEDFQMLLARVLLRGEKFSEAKNIAEGLRKNTADPKLRSEADEVLRTVDEVFAVRKVDQAPRILYASRLLFVKRSTVTDADIARFDEDRRINNLNYLLERPVVGMKQVVGYIDRVTCTDDGINYSVRLAAEKLTFASKDFISLRLKVLTEGEKAFKIDCGTSFTKQLTVLTFRPAPDAENTVAGQLAAITFVPDYFRLKSPEELAKARLVVVEDDTLRSPRLKRTSEPTASEKNQPF